MRGLSLKNPAQLMKLFLRAELSMNYGRRKEIIGLQMAEFGRNLGWRLLLRKPSVAIPLLLTPVNIVRYFEFPFTYKCLPSVDGKWLDISSPRLFSYYTANHRKSTQIVYTNPDKDDYSRSKNIASLSGFRNIDFLNKSIDFIREVEDSWDVIWSISVIEHIDGSYTDREAVQWMYRALRPGGRLILTFPVDRVFRNEFRGKDLYGLQAEQRGDEFFFQRHYDLKSIGERILEPLGRDPTRIEWFGETRAGTFESYEQRWMERGAVCTVDDPREIVNKYRVFDSWEMMPGQGVCGMLIEKER